MTARPYKKMLLVMFVSMFVFTTAMTTMPKKAEACCSCIVSTFTKELTEWPQILFRTSMHSQLRFSIHKRLFMAYQFWGNNMSVAIKDMAEELSGVMFQQTLAIGTLLDAQHQMETQQILQTLQARAHKDYHPSIGMCEFISHSRSLADSERKGEIAQMALSQRSQDRLQGNTYTAAASGTAQDIESRFEQFRWHFCNPEDHNGKLNNFCVVRTRDPNDFEMMNLDIDYNRAIDYPYTLDVDFTNDTLTEHERMVVALSSNLYSHSAFQRAKRNSLLSGDNDDLTTAQEKFMDLRALNAKLSVAENSFNAIAGMKSAGSPGAAEFLHAVFENLAMDPEHAPQQIIGEQPSYHAQMEVLSKHMLQNPDFYTNLYDKPANVERKGVALQAIGLIQKFDLFKSHLRNEASLSVLLEIAVNELQTQIENEINTEKNGAPKGGTN